MVGNKVTAAFSCFKSDCEEDLSNFWMSFWTSGRFILKQLDYSRISITQTSRGEGNLVRDN